MLSKELSNGFINNNDQHADILTKPLRESRIFLDIPCLVHTIYMLQIEGKCWNWLYYFVANGGSLDRVDPPTRLFFARVSKQVRKNPKKPTLETNSRTSLATARNRRRCARHYSRLQHYSPFAIACVRRSSLLALTAIVLLCFSLFAALFGMKLSYFIMAWIGESLIIGRITSNSLLVVQCIFMNYQPMFYQPMCKYWILFFI